MGFPRSLFLCLRERSAKGDNEDMNSLSLLAVYAHPDDEAYGSAGTFAKYAHEGVRVALVSATRGEAGEISDASLASVASLAEVREGELRRSCELLGVEDLRFLDCPDGGVATCAPSETIGKIVATIREWRPQVIITFGPEGIYGHPDHVAVHHMTVAAADMAGDVRAYPEQVAAGLAPYAPKKLYYRVIPRRQMPQLAQLFQDIRDSLGLKGGNIEDLFARDELVTTAIDVAQYAEVKRQAVAAHKTQISGDPFADMSPDEVREELGREYYHRRGALRAPGEQYESDLFAGVR